MPRRHRVAKRRPSEEIAALFVHSDGLTPNLTGDPVFENAFLARAAWRAHRVQAWRHPWRDPMWPPHGAIAWDKISAQLTGVVIWPPLPDHRSRWTVSHYRRAYKTDVASVARFRAQDPEAALEVVDELDEYVTELHHHVEMAEAVAGD